MQYTHVYSRENPVSAPPVRIVLNDWQLLEKAVDVLDSYSVCYFAEEQNCVQGKGAALDFPGLVFPEVTGLGVGDMKNLTV